MKRRCQSESGKVKKLNKRRGPPGCKEKNEVKDVRAGGGKEKQRKIGRYQRKR